jgi:hypothetical protein
MEPERSDQQEILFEEYQKKFWHRSKFWLGIVLCVLFIVFVLVFKRTIVDTSMTADELKSSIELFDISSQWVVKEKITVPGFQGVILVPEVSFRIRNIGTRKLSYVFLLGVFRFLDNGKTIGEGYQMTLRRPLPPGRESDGINLRCGFGYRASSAEAFEKNRKDWMNAFTEVFVKSKNSKLVLIKTFYISRRISGEDIEVKTSPLPAKP